MSTIEPRIAKTKPSKGAKARGSRSRGASLQPETSPSQVDARRLDCQDATLGPEHGTGLSLGFGIFNLRQVWRLPAFRLQEASSRSSQMGS